LVLAHGSGGRLFEVLALAAGLYGPLGCCRRLCRLGRGTAIAAVPGGWRALRENRDLDGRAAAALLGLAAAAWSWPQAPAPLTGSSWPRWPAASWP